MAGLSLGMLVGCGPGGGVQNDRVVLMAPSECSLSVLTNASSFHFFTVPKDQVKELLPMVLLPNFYFPASMLS
jgi:hypothetical protein